MSKIGKKEIIVPLEVTITIGADSITVSGKKGTLLIPRLEGLEFNNEQGVLTVTKLEAERQKNSMALWGTQRALLANAVEGIQNGYEKKLELEGVGYRAAMEGEALILHLGLSHPIRVVPPQGVTIGTEKNTITVSGVDKALVGQVAANVRALKKPEPYKGKGIHYVGEIIRRKAGKKMAGASS
ncbi:MAG: 50S ribosomal protein L6 [Patescibacteria group bacterium]|nr:50S ribosomal protein L6 [Patescibacteria group bacterium]MDE2437822.1 50S ribosomal protein L6 [Patescibacteria group bacterium]